MRIDIPGLEPIVQILGVVLPALFILYLTIRRLRLYSYEQERNLDRRLHDHSQSLREEMNTMRAHLTTMNGNLHRDLDSMRLGMSRTNRMMDLNDEIGLLRQNIAISLGVPESMLRDSGVTENGRSEHTMNPCNEIFLARDTNSPNIKPSNPLDPIKKASRLGLIMDQDD